jgi:threonine dehydrogenase-like Zn-dependent dehydrogenase
MSTTIPANLPTSGRASVVTGWEQPLEVREYPLVAPPPGGLLVRIDKATICGSDVHAWEGMLSAIYDIDLPIILGHEQVGEIVAFGDGADRDSVGEQLRVGDRVVWAHEACGHCYACTVERTGTLCTDRRIGFLTSADEAPHFHGGFAEYTYVRPRAGRLKVPDVIRSEWAAASSCALRTVIDAIIRLGAVDFTDNVVIQGDGPLGLFATAVLATHEPQKIVVIGGSDQRLAVARAWGADVTISVAEATSVEERRALVLDATDGRGGDVVGEFSGARDAVAEGIGLAAANGRYVVAGTVGGAPQTIAAHLITHKNLRIFGSLSAEIDAYYKALDFMARARDRFDWDLMMGKTYGLGEVGAGLARMQAFDEIKAVIDPSL